MSFPPIFSENSECVRRTLKAVVSPQAREDIIGLLRSQRTGPETLEGHYGSAVPARPLQALQRDGLLTGSGGGGGGTDDVYEKPMAEVSGEIYRGDVGQD